MAFNILHLSDLQFGNTKAAHSRIDRDLPVYQPEFHTAIIKALDGQGAYPTVVVLSGDVAEAGRASDYEAARDFVIGLHNALCDRTEAAPKWIIVPGNHDVFRPASESTEAHYPGNVRRRREMMLANYREFVHGLGILGVEVHSPPLQGTGVFSFADADMNRIAIVPLDSCAAEGHSVEQHYGAVAADELDAVEATLRGNMHPWTLRIAVVHHNVVLNAPSVEALRHHVASLVDDPHIVDRIVGSVSNTLRQPEKLLARLADMGIQLVLHGHQHYDGPIHLSFPQPADNPVGHSGITVVSAGSAGIDVGGDQPSVPSFQSYRLRKMPSTWSVTSSRFVVHRLGERQPSLLVQVSEPNTWECYSSRTSSLHAGILNLLPGASKDEEPPYTPHLCQGFTFSEAVGTTDILGVADDVISLKCTTDMANANWETQLNQQLWHEAGDLVNHSSWFLRGLRQDRMYADLPHWALDSFGSDGKTASLTVSSYLHYVATNMRLRLEHAPSMRALDRRSLHKTPSDLNHYLSAVHAKGLSRRVTLQVVIEVQGDDQSYVLLKGRSQDVGHMAGQVQFAVGGGMKFALARSHDTQERAEMPPKTLAEPFREEIRLEVGMRPEHFTQRRLACITLNSHTYAPAFTMIAQMHASTFEQLYDHVNVLGTSDSRSEVSFWRPTRTPRDWWENSYLLMVPLVGINATQRPTLWSEDPQDKARVRSGWSALEDIWNHRVPHDLDEAISARWAMVKNDLNDCVFDPYPGSAIECVHSWFSA